jgi:hypothetical protein
MFTALRSVVLGGIVVSACLAAACSSASTSAAGAVGTSGETAPFMGVQLSSIVMVIENQAAQPLLDVRLAIKPVGGATEFTKLVSRMEAGEKRTISLGDFGGRDGTPFSLRVVRPKEVGITAVNLTGQKFAMTVPWK